MSNQSLRAVVTGRVQGVNFRYFVFTRARSLHLRGYVRNLDDGRAVEVLAEGPRTDLEKLLEHLRDGPRMARVDTVEVQWARAMGEHQVFSIID